MEKITRRKFLKTTGFTAGSIALSSLACCRASEEGIKRQNNTSGGQDKSRVAVVKRPDWFEINRQPDSLAVEKLLKSTLQALFDLSDAREGLRELINPNDTIGIKVNCLSGHSMSTHPQLTWAMVALLKEIDLKEDKIIIWDRRNADLEAAGYDINTGAGVKIYGARESGYSRELLIHRSIGSFTAIIMQRVDKIINLPVLKDHGIVGITLSLKNFFGAIHNPNKYHPDNGDPYIADLFSHPLFRDKVKLNIADGIVGQYDGGPPPQPQWQWNFGGLIAGIDPVAVDSVGLDLIEAARQENGRPTLNEVSRYPQYLLTAEKLGIGNFKKQNLEIAYS